MNLFRTSLVGGALLLAIGGGWYSWHWYTTPQPPEIDLGSSGDPALARAVEDLRQEVCRAPRSAAAWGRLGQILAVHAYIVEAKPCLIQAERLDPTDARWPYLQGWGALLNHPEEAVPCFQRALQLAAADRPREAAARLRLAQTLLDRGDLEAAAAQFRPLLSSDFATLAHLGLGSVALDKGDLPEAVTHLQDSTDSPLSRQRACTRLAAAYRRQGNQQLADEWDGRSRQLQKDMEWPDPFLREGEEMVVGKQMRFLRAENLQRDGRLREAADQFRQFIRDYPDDTRARVKLGMVLVETGEYQDAERVLRELLRIEPGKIQGHFLLSAALFHQAERSAKNPGEKGKMLQQFQEAADQARQALDRQPNHGFAHVYLGLALRNLGQLDEAVRALEAAVRCSPESVDPHLHLGETLLQLGRRDQGIKQLEDAVRVAPAFDTRPLEALKRVRGTG